MLNSLVGKSYNYFLILAIGCLSHFVYNNNFMYICTIFSLPLKKVSFSSLTYRNHIIRRKHHTH